MRFIFERGGEFTAYLLEREAPRTCHAILDILPISGTVVHSRWSGREVNMAIKTLDKPPKENMTSQTSIGDVIYWREWEGLYEGRDIEVIAIYYGPEVTRDHRGYQPVNVFARIPEKYHNLLKEIGERIWRKGEERLRIEKC